MCNLQKSTFSPRPKTYQTFSLCLASLISVSMISRVVYCAYKPFRAMVKLPQWWLQIKNLDCFQWKLNDLTEITFFLFIFFLGLSQSCRMVTNEQVTCHLGFLCSDGITEIEKNTERTSDGNTSLDCIIFCLTFSFLFRAYFFFILK